MTLAGEAKTAKLMCPLTSHLGSCFDDDPNIHGSPLNSVNPYTLDEDPQVLPTPSDMRCGREEIRLQCWKLTSNQHISRPSSATPQGRLQPAADPSKIRCARSQSNHRCNPAKIIATAPRGKPPFGQTVARIPLAIYGSRTCETLKSVRDPSQFPADRHRSTIRNLLCFLADHPGAGSAPSTFWR